MNLCIPAPPLSKLQPVLAASMAPSLALNAYHKWPDYIRTVQVAFMGGESYQHEIVKGIIQSSESWNAAAGLQFRFDGDLYAPVRISFLPGASWSYVGNYCLGVPREQPTMNLGWILPNTSPTENRRVVLHEFGHASGYEHEHKRPDAHIPWDMEKVYEYYQQVSGWDRDTVDAQVIAPIAAEMLALSPEFDPDSIMCYLLPTELMTDPDWHCGGATRLSETDIAQAQEWYGPPPSVDPPVPEPEDWQSWLPGIQNA